MKRILNVRIIKDIKNIKLKGMSFVEVMIVVVIMLIVAVSGMSAYASSINKAKMALLMNDFATLKVACSQMLYENSGLGTGRINTTDFYKYFNQYLDSNCNLKDDGKTMLKKDPWDSPYQLKFVQVSASETKITIDSVGRSNKVDFELLVHYKNGEVRTGTAGFDNNEGSDTSDAKVVSGVAAVTDMWSK